jgi:hypothetical protein
VSLFLKGFVNAPRHEMIVVEASQECQLQSHPCRLLLFEILIEMLKQSFQNQGEKKC